MQNARERGQGVTEVSLPAQHLICAMEEVALNDFAASMDFGIAFTSTATEDNNKHVTVALKWRTTTTLSLYAGHSIPNKTEGDGWMQPLPGVQTPTQVQASAQGDHLMLLLSPKQRTASGMQGSFMSHRKTVVPGVKSSPLTAWKT